MSIDELKIRKPGRPNDAKSYSGKCDVRLDKTELSMLERLSTENGVTRSDIMRRALRDFYNFCTNSGKD